MSDEIDEVATFFDAGSRALAMNSPVDSGRLATLVRNLVSTEDAPVVDLGCGRGTFVHEVLLANDVSFAVGIDSQADSIADAVRIADELGVGARASFACEDAAAWRGPIRVGICIGSSHAFGEPANMFSRILELGAEHAIIGDGFWASDPDDWCLENLGEMPRGFDALRALAIEAGWSIDSADISTLAEWDAFEGVWGEGVRSIDTDAARAFVDKRAEEYQRYRGVLGFGWLRLSRSR
jgi:SAM-dependent methyltransferase